jgi:hypothetical protein
MTADEFREIALSFPETEERSHMEHPDFRVRGKIFATLGPGLKWGMAKLTPAQQQEFMLLAPDLRPAAGKWGLGGATIIQLEEADPVIVRQALGTAWQNVGAKK